MPRRIRRTFSLESLPIYLTKSLYKRANNFDILAFNTEFLDQVVYEAASVAVLARLLVNGDNRKTSRLRDLEIALVVQGVVTEYKAKRLKVRAGKGHLSVNL